MEGEKFVLISSDGWWLVADSGSVEKKVTRTSAGVKLFKLNANQKLAKVVNLNQAKFLMKIKKVQKKAAINLAA